MSEIAKPESTDRYPSVGLVGRIDRLNFDLLAARRGLPSISDESVKLIECKHVLQYLTGGERIAVWNEWYRVLQPEGRVLVVVPHYSHVRAFAHPLTQWPPLSDLSFFFLDRAWREENESRTVPLLDCDFVVDAIDPHYDATPELGYMARPQAWKDDAARWYNNVLAELTVWLVKR